MPDKASHASYMRVYRALRKPQRVPDLSWPTNLYGHPMAIEDLLRADATYKPPPIGKVANDDARCKCGCGKEHRGNVTMTVNSTHGRGFNVYYFYLEACKTRYVALNGRK